jgi:hypothetical protein
MSLFEAGFNLPPGVSPNDPHLTGEYPCANCGATLPEEYEGEPFDGDECPGGCDEPDWDAERDRRAEASAEDRYGY